MKKLMAIFFCFSVGYINADQVPDIPLTKLLTQQELESLEESKMTNAQKEIVRVILINKFIAGYEAGTKKGIEQAITYQQKQTSTPATVEGQIDGEFEGFEGETIFKLTNGQVWQQSEYWYYYHYSYMPKVLIFKSGAGYKVKVDGIDKAVSVNRLN